MTAGIQLEAMEVENLLGSMKERVPWSVAVRIFAKLDIKPGQGWSGTIRKYSERPELLVNVIGQLAEGFETHALHAEKMVSLADLDATDRQKLLASLRGVRSNSGIQNMFVQLEATGPSSETNGRPSSYVQERADGVMVSFESMRAIKKRVKLTAEDIAADDLDADDLKAVRQNLLPYEEIIGYRTMKIRVHDQVFVPYDENAPAQIRIDCPEGFGADIASGARRKFVSDLSTLSGVSFNFRNLAAAIMPIYEDAKEGRVAALSFSTSTSSMKRETMKSGGDLRFELYHAGGKKALQTPISPHQISVRWRDRDENDKFDMLELAIKAREVEHDGAFADACMITRGMDEEDFNFVLDRLLHHLPAE